MATRKKTFDAVLASRRWKETVARKTSGMSAGQVLAFFNRDKALSRMQSCRKQTSCRVAAN
jgi:hypothetical protein